MAEALRMVLTLVVTCVLAGTALAGVYTTTAPIIAAQAAQALQDGLIRVLPGAQAFEPVPSDQLPPDGKVVQGIWAGRDAAGHPAGWVVEAVPTGYGGGIRMLVGVTPEGRVQQVEILAATGETPGLGSKVTEPAFLGQFAGLQGPIALVKGRPPAGNEIAAITGATISSRAILDGVNEALQAVAQLQKAR